MLRLNNWVKEEPNIKWREHCKLLIMAVAYHISLWALALKMWWVGQETDWTEQIWVRQRKVQ